MSHATSNGNGNGNGSHHEHPYARLRSYRQGWIAAGLTGAQIAALEALVLRQRHIESGVPITLERLARDLGRSRGAVHEMVRRLELAGWIVTTGSYRVHRRAIAPNDPTAPTAPVRSPARVSGSTGARKSAQESAQDLARISAQVCADQSAQVCADQSAHPSKGQSGTRSPYERSAQKSDGSEHIRGVHPPPVEPARPEPSPPAPDELAFARAQLAEIRDRFPKMRRPPKPVEEPTEDPS